MEFDPQLDIIRSCIEAMPKDEKRHRLVTQRYKLFAALDVGDRENARQWAKALEQGLLARLVGQPTVVQQELVKAARAALEEITKGLS